MSLGVKGLNQGAQEIERTISAWKTGRVRIMKTVCLTTCMYSATGLIQFFFPSMK